MNLYLHTMIIKIINLISAQKRCNINLKNHFILYDTIFNQSRFYCRSLYRWGLKSTLVLCFIFLSHVFRDFFHFCDGSGLMTLWVWCLIHTNLVFGQESGAKEANDLSISLKTLNNKKYDSNFIYFSKKKNYWEFGR